MSLKEIVTNAVRGFRLAGTMTTKLPATKQGREMLRYLHAPTTYNPEKVDPSVREQFEAYRLEYAFRQDSRAFTMGHDLRLFGAHLFFDDGGFDDAARQYAKQMTGKDPVR